MKPTAYLITSDDYDPSVCLHEELERTLRGYDGRVCAAALYTEEQIGQAIMQRVTCPAEDSQT